MYFSCTSAVVSTRQGKKGNLQDIGAQDHAKQYIFYGFLICAITIFEVWRYAITIRLFQELQLQFYLSLVHTIFYAFSVHVPIVRLVYV